MLIILQCGHFAMSHYARMYLVALVAFACWHTYIAQHRAELYGVVVKGIELSCTQEGAFSVCEQHMLMW